MIVSDYMTRNVITASSKQRVDEVARVIAEQNIGGLPVVNEANEVVGVISESDLLPKPKKVPFSGISLPALFHEWVDEDGIEKLFDAARAKEIQEVMTRDPITIKADDSVTDAAVLLGKHHIRRLPVIQDGKLVGIISRGDVLRALAKVGE